MRPTKYHHHFGLSHGFLDTRFLFLANLTLNQMLDLARDRHSNFHSQPQTSVTTNCLMEMILEGTALGEHIVQTCAATGLPPFSLNVIGKGRLINAPLPPIPGFGPNAGLLFQYHVYPPGVNMDNRDKTASYPIPSHANLFEDIPHARMFLPVALVCELLRSPLTTILAITMLVQLRLQNRN
jgi:hypothetical protein